MSGVFVTGTDTGIGKTVVACGLLRAFCAAGTTALGFKPVASGAVPRGGSLVSDDAEALLQAGADPGLPLDRINPVCLAAPVAPHLAAAPATITLPPILAAYSRLRRAACVVIAEGAGGWRVPLSLSPPLDTVDVVRALGLPVLLVVGLRLGCISHARLTAEAIHADGVPWAGWVGNVLVPEMPALEGNLATLARLLPAPCLGIVRACDDEEAFAAIAASLRA